MFFLVKYLFYSYKLRLSLPSKKSITDKFYIFHSVASRIIVSTSYDFGGYSSEISSAFFFRPIKVRSMFHHRAEWASSEQNKGNLTSTLTLTLNLLPFGVLYNKVVSLS